MSDRTDNQVIMAWLNDAYAMEQAQIKFLEMQLNRHSDFPELQEKVREHLSKTQAQADVLRGRIEQLGGAPSTIKANLGKAMGYMQSLYATIAGDSLVKTAIAMAASEQFEVHTYKVLKFLSEKADDVETAKLCDRTIDEEQEMMAWITERLPKLALFSRYAAK